MKIESKIQSGRSMIEMLGVLAIVGVLSVGALTGYSQAMKKYNLNKTEDQINNLIIGIADLYEDQKSYSSLDASVLKDSGLLPDEMFYEE
ncbi:MAG: type II secretion system protein [Alphaproteobacteria bacterium]|nr:type II secretion system protein [Alphaproteobacteria bacterium]